MHTEKRPPAYLPLTAAALLTLTVLARGMGYIYSTMATDIAYSEVTVSVMGILVELLTILRTVTGYAAILYAMSRWDHDHVRSGPPVLVTVLCLDAVDYFSRYLVDSATHSITNMETAAALWLLIQFAYSTLLLLVSFGLGSRLLHPKSPRVPEGLDTLLTVSIACLLVSRLLLELYYLLDFVTTYSNVTPTEVSSIIGQFLYTLVLYGGVAWVAAMAVAALLRSLWGNGANG